jgi:hypothetical protein
MNLTNTKDGSEMESKAAEVTQAVSDPGSGNGSKQSPRGPAKPVSPQKLAANRENAKHSTGPKTAQGKQKSRNNAYRHGFFSSQSIDKLTDGMELGEPFITLIDGIREYFQPVGFIEELLTDKIVCESVRLRRVLAYESKIVAQLGAFHLRGVDPILRFLSASNKQLFQAIHELERMQEKRKADPNSANGSDREMNDEDTGPVTASDSQDCGLQGKAEGADIPAANNNNQPAAGGESSLSEDCRPTPTVGDLRAGREAADFGTNPPALENLDGTAPVVFPTKRIL